MCLALKTPSTHTSSGSITAFFSWGGGGGGGGGGLLGTLCWLAINLVTSYTALFIIKILFNLTQTYTLTNETIYYCTHWDIIIMINIE